MSSIYHIYVLFIYTYVTLYYKYIYPMYILCIKRINHINFSQYSTKRKINNVITHNKIDSIKLRKSLLESI